MNPNWVFKQWDEKYFDSKLGIVVTTAPSLWTRPEQGEALKRAP